MSEYTCPECKDTGVYQGLNTVEPCRACGNRDRNGSIIANSIGESLVSFAYSPTPFNLASLETICQQFATPESKPPTVHLKATEKSQIENSREFTERVNQLGMIKRIPLDTFHVSLVRFTYNPAEMDTIIKAVGSSEIARIECEGTPWNHAERVRKLRNSTGIKNVLIKSFEPLEGNQCNMQLEFVSENHGKRIDEIVPAEWEGLGEGRSVDVMMDFLDIVKVLNAVQCIVDRPLFGFPRKSFMLTSVGWDAGPTNFRGTLKLLSIYGGADLKDGYAGLYRCDPCEDITFLPIVEDADA